MNMDFGIGLLSGFVVGMITGGIGAFKDSAFEGFSIRTFFRSPVIATFYGGVAVLLTNNPLLMAGFASTSERISVELWKAIIGKKPSKFKIETKDRGWLLRHFQK